MDEFLKEFGLGSVIRMLAKNSKPRVIISEANGVWTIRTESVVKTITLDFRPGVEYDDTAPDGRKIKVRVLIGSVDRHPSVSPGYYQFCRRPMDSVNHR